MPSYGLPSTNTLDYTGWPQALVPLRPFPRIPLTTDKKYRPGQTAIITKDPQTGVEGDLYYLAFFDNSGLAQWRKLGSSTGNAETLTTDDGTVVQPNGSGTIFLAGDSTTGTITSGSGSTATVKNILASDAESIAGTVTNKLIVPSSLKAKLGTQTSGGVAYGATTSGAVGWTAHLNNGQIAIGSTAGNPVAANLTSTDGSIIITNGPNSINLSTTGSGSNEVQSITTDDAVVVLPNSAGNINFFGNATQGVNTTGDIATFKVTMNVNHANSAQTIAGSATDLVVDPAGLNAKLGTQTANGVCLGGGSTAALLYTGVLSNGQLLIGRTGLFPALGNLTSADGTVTITNGVGSIDLSSGGGWTYTVYDYVDVLPPANIETYTLADYECIEVYAFYFSKNASASTPASTLGGSIHANFGFDPPTNHFSYGTYVFTCNFQSGGGTPLVTIPQTQINGNHTNALSGPGGASPGSHSRVYVWKRIYAL